MEREKENGAFMGAEDIKKKKLHLLICVTIAFAILLALFILNRKHTAVPEYVFSYACLSYHDFPILAISIFARCHPGNPFKDFREITRIPVTDFLSYFFDVHCNI